MTRRKSRLKRNIRKVKLVRKRKVQNVSDTKQILNLLKSRPITTPIPFYGYNIPVQQPPIQTNQIPLELSRKINEIIAQQPRTPLLALMDEKEDSKVVRKNSQIQDRLNDVFGDDDDINPRRFVPVPSSRLQPYPSPSPSPSPSSSDGPSYLLPQRARDMLNQVNKPPQIVEITGKRGRPRKVRPLEEQRTIIDTKIASINRRIASNTSGKKAPLTRWSSAQLNDQLLALERERLSLNAMG